MFVVVKNYDDKCVTMDLEVPCVLSGGLLTNTKDKKDSDGRKSGYIFIRFRETSVDFLSNRA